MTPTPTTTADPDQFVAWLTAPPGIGRAYLADRLLGRRREGYHGYGRSPYHANRQRRRGGFVGPFPYYSGRTRRGTRVTVGGCCLPIPLGVLTVSALGLRLLMRR